MSDAQSIPQTVYNSCFQHGVDEKRRLQIPAKWRPEDDGVELTMMLWPKHNAGMCLRVLPPVQMAQLMADIDAMPKGDEKKIYLKRFIGSESAQVTLDKAGRICIPDEMARERDLIYPSSLSNALARLVSAVAQQTPEFFASWRDARRKLFSLPARQPAQARPASARMDFSPR